MTRPYVVLLILILLSGIFVQAGAQNFVPAKPYGEESLLQDFLCAEVTYPPKALAEGTEGTVILSFIVTDQGEVENLRVRQSVSPDIDAEAIRLFRMLIWVPAVKFGTPVSTSNEFPIKFNIKKYEKHCKARGYDRTEFPVEPVDSSNIVYQVNQLDKPPYPVFADKNMTLARFINENIKYPETAYRQSISGKVALRFVVEPQGRISNVKVVEPVSGGCTQEAIRLLQLIHWMPGMKNNEAVRSFMTMEIKFKLPEQSDLKMFENTQMNSN